VTERAVAIVKDVTEAESPLPKAASIHAVTWIMPTSGRRSIRKTTCRILFDATTSAIGRDHE